MRKLNSIILPSLLTSSLLIGCGMPGPLYQEPQGDQPNNVSEQAEKDQKEEQQEQ